MTGSADGQRQGQRQHRGESDLDESGVAEGVRACTAGIGNVGLVVTERCKEGKQHAADGHHKAVVVEANKRGEDIEKHAVLWLLLSAVRLQPIVCRSKESGACR